MALQVGTGGELHLVLRVDDKGSLVVDRFADKTQKSAKKSSKAFDDFSDAFGVNMRSVAFVAGLASAAFVAGAGIMIKNAIDLADRAGETAERLGLTTEALTAMRHAADMSGVATQTLEMALQRMQRRVSEAARGTGEAVGALRELGLDANRLAELSPDQQFLAMAEALSKLTNANERTRLAFKLFDSEGVALVQMMGEGREGIEAFMREAERLGKVISTETAQAAGDFKDTTDRLKASLSGLAITAAGPVARGLNDMIERFNLLIGVQEQLSTGVLRNELKDLGVELERLNERVTTIGFVEPFVARARIQIRERMAEIERLLADSEKPGATIPDPADVANVGGAAADKFRELLGELERASREQQAALIADAEAAAAMRIQIERDEWRAKAEAAKLGVEQRAQFEGQLERFLARRREVEQAAIAEARLAAQTAAREDLRRLAEQERVAQEAAAGRFDRLRASLDEEFAAEQEHRARVRELHIASAMGLIDSDAELKALREQLELEHQARIGNITAQARLERIEADKDGARGRTQAVLKEMQVLTQGVATHSRLLFELNKVATVANTLLNVPEAVSAAYAWGAEFGGPPLGAAMAAIAFAAQMAQVQAALSAQFGAATSAPSIAGGNAIPVQPVGGGAVPPPPLEQAPGSQVTIIINGFVGQELLDDQLIPAIQDATENRDVLLFGRQSRQAREARAA